MRRRRRRFDRMERLDQHLSRHVFPVSLNARAISTRPSPSISSVNSRSGTPSSPPACCGHSTRHSAPAIEIFAKARVGPFGGIGEAVEIEVIDVERARRRCERVRLDERVSRAAHASRVTERAQCRAHERGLARAEVADQLDLQAGEIVRFRSCLTHGVECQREAFAERERRGFVRKIEAAFELRHSRKRRCKWMLHRAGAAGIARKMS